MFERFNERARRIVVLAQEEARQLNHDYIGTEHLLLGLLNDDNDALAPAWRGSGSALAAAREQVELSRPRGQKPVSGFIAFTPSAKRTLEQSLVQAERLGVGTISPGHVLRGMLTVDGCTGVQVLTDLGVDIAELAGALDERGSESVSQSARPARTRVLTFEDSPPSARESLLAAALRRYGRYEAGCDPVSGCSCGLQAIRDQFA